MLWLQRHRKRPDASEPRTRTRSSQALDVALAARLTATRPGVNGYGRVAGRRARRGTMGWMAAERRDAGAGPGIRAPAQGDELEGHPTIRGAARREPSPPRMGGATLCSGPRSAVFSAEWGSDSVYAITGDRALGRLEGAFEVSQSLEQ